MSRTRTNYEACEQVKKYWLENPKIEFGFIDETQQNFIRDTYELKECTVLELRDARDFTSLKITFDTFPISRGDDTTVKLIDCKSAIVHMIDIELADRGEDI